MITDIQTVYRLILSVILCGAVGLERGAHRRAAGLRTHILVGVGSTLIMLISIYVFETYRAKGSIDPGRIAANVVTGIGFLGAGTIMRSGSSVKGLTTAASIWAVAGIGLAVGCGYYFGAFFTTVIILASLLVLRRVEELILRNK